MTRERITSLNPHFYTTSSAPFEGTVTAVDGVDTNFLAKVCSYNFGVGIWARNLQFAIPSGFKLTRDVDRDSATVDLIYLGLPSPALVKVCVIYYRVSKISCDI